MKRTLSLLASLAVAAQCGAAHGGAMPEAHYQERWCAAAGGSLEFVLPDRARVDCLTGTHAVEVDFAPKWAEAIGQSLYYAAMTGKRPGVVLIMGEAGDERHLARLRAVANGLGIEVWLVGPVP